MTDVIGRHRDEAARLLAVGRWSKVRPLPAFSRKLGAWLAFAVVDAAGRNRLDITYTAETKAGIIWNGGLCMRWRRETTANIARAVSAYRSGHPMVRAVYG